MRRLTTVLALVLTTAILLASCSSVEESQSTSTSSIGTQDTPSALALADETTVPTTSSTSAPTTTGSPALDLISETTSPSTTTPTSVTNGEVSTATTGIQNAGGGSNGTQAPVDLMSQYLGVVGNYGLHDVLAVAPAPAPEAIPGAAPLTGLPGGLAGPAVVVKIDNSGRATPQSGLNVADIIIEEEVEWGITRLAAIFQSQHSVVGPVRSGRTTDISFLGSLGNPALAYSGANKIVDTLLLRQDYVQNFSAARNGAYWRERSRRAPSNLYTNSASFANAGAPPQPWFAYRQTSGTAVGTPVSQVSLTLGNNNVQWLWSDGTWVRNQKGKPHLTDGGAQVSASNIVVATVAMVNSGMVDSSGGMVPEFVWAGTGDVSVFTNGLRIDGTWTRATLADPAILVDGAGNVIELTPGRTWVELVIGAPVSS